MNPSAPISAAASSSSFPCAFKIGTISLEINGNVTKTVAKITPGIANTIFISNTKNLFNAVIYGAAQPILPKVIMKARPAITGEIEKGMSISVAKICFPRKENFVRSHAAVIPKKVFIISAEIVAIIVTFKAERTYLSVRLFM